MRIIIAVLLLAGLAYAASFACAIHPNSQCYGTGQYRYVNGQSFELHRCNACSDQYWVKQ